VTRLQINIDRYSMNTGKKMLLGTSSVSGKLEYYSIQWDKGFKEVKVEPLTRQLHKGLMINSSFKFSPDSKWVKSNITEVEYPEIAQQLIIYHISDIYPQGLSKPIIFGYSDRTNPGAFMNHSQWGPCYLEQDPYYPEKLFVYKLNKGKESLHKSAH